MRRPCRVEVGVVAAPVIASVVAVLTFSLGPVRADTFRADEAAALGSARARLGSMFTFSHRDLETDLMVASSNATGTFREVYAARLRKLASDSLETSRASVSSRVENVALVDSDASGVTVVAELRARTESEGREPAWQTFQVRARMQGKGSQWLVSSLTRL